jgi:hypothetical protein
MASTRPTLLSLFTAAVLFLHFYQTSAVVTWGASCPSNIRAPLLQDTIAMARAGYEALNNPESLDPWGRYNADAVYDVLFDAQHPKTITRRQGLIGKALLAVQITTNDECLQTTSTVSYTFSTYRKKC